MKFQLQGLKFWEDVNILFGWTNGNSCFCKAKAVLSVSHDSTDTFVFHEGKFKILKVPSTFIPHSHGKFSQILEILRILTTCLDWKSSEIQLWEYREKKEENQEKNSEEDLC